MVIDPQDRAQLQHHPGWMNRRSSLAGDEAAMSS
jgi:hypothetical protein